MLYVSRLEEWGTRWTKTARSEVTKDIVAYAMLGKSSCSKDLLGSSFRKDLPRIGYYRPNEQPLCPVRQSTVRVQKVVARTCFLNCRLRMHLLSHKKTYPTYKCVAQEHVGTINLLQLAIAWTSMVRNPTRRSNRSSVVGSNLPKHRTRLSLTLRQPHNLAHNREQTYVLARSDSTSSGARLNELKHSMTRQWL